VQREERSWTLPGVRDSNHPDTNTPNTSNPTKKGLEGESRTRKRSSDWRKRGEHRGKDVSTNCAKGERPAPHQKGSQDGEETHPRVGRSYRGGPKGGEEWDAGLRGRIGLRAGDLASGNCEKHRRKTAVSLVAAKNAEYRITKEGDFLEDEAKTERVFEREEILFPAKKRRNCERVSLGDRANRGEEDAERAQTTSADGYLVSEERLTHQGRARKRRGKKQSRAGRGTDDAIQTNTEVLEVITHFEVLGSRWSRKEEKDL